MKNKLFIGLALGACALSLASCDKKKNLGSYDVKVTDIDGEVIFEKNLKIEKDKNILDNLEKVTDVVVSDGMVKSIAGSGIDYSYYLAIYENGEYSQVGATDIELNDGDNIEFKVECWNTKESGYGILDETDILVDKAIYGYAKNYLNDSVSDAEDYASASFWSYMFVNTAKSLGYDSNVFTLEANTKVVESLNNETFENISSIQNWGKYYYAAKAYDVSLDTYKVKYQEYIDTVQTTYNENFSEYSIPFAIAPAKTLNITSDNLETLVSTTYRASTTFGVDALAWELTVLGLYGKIEASELSSMTVSIETSDEYDMNYAKIGEYNNATSTALKLLPYAALGENVRDSKYENSDGKDLVELLMDTFYDSTSNVIKYRDDKDFSIEYSTNQIYASLFTYKAVRDKGEAVNIFA